jgi:hypothetical protein
VLILLFKPEKTFQFQYLCLPIKASGRSST